MRQITRLSLILAIAVVSMGAGAVALKLSVHPPPTPDRAHTPNAAMIVFDFTELPLGPLPTGWELVTSRGVTAKLSVRQTPRYPIEKLHELWLEYDFGAPPIPRQQIVVTCPPTALPPDSWQLRALMGASGHPGYLALLVQDGRGTLYEASAGDLSVCGEWSSVMVGPIVSLGAADLVPAQYMPQSGLLRRDSPAAAETKTNPQSGLQALSPANPAEGAGTPPALAETATASAPNPGEPATAAPPGSPEEPAAAPPDRSDEARTATSAAGGRDASLAAAEPTAPSPPLAKPEADTSKLVLRGFVLRPTTDSARSGRLRLHYIEAVTGAALALEETQLTLETPEGTGMMTRRELDQVRLRVQAGTIPVVGTLVCELRFFSGQRWRREQKVNVPAGRVLAMPLPTRPPGEGHYRYHVALHASGSQGIFASGTLAVVPQPTAAGKQRFGLGSFPVYWQEQATVDLLLAQVARAGAGWFLLRPDSSQGTPQGLEYWVGVTDEHLVRAPAHGLKLLVQAWLSPSANDTEYKARQLARARRSKASLWGWWIPFAYSEGNEPNERLAREISAALGRKAIVAPTFPTPIVRDGSFIGRSGVHYSAHAMGVQFPNPPGGFPPTPLSLDEFARYRADLDRGQVRLPVWAMSNAEHGGDRVEPPYDAEAVARRQACRLAIQMARWTTVLRPGDRWHYETVTDYGINQINPDGLYDHQGPKPAAAAFATAVSLLAEARPAEAQEFAGDGCAQHFSTPRGPLTVCFQKDKYGSRGKPRQRVTMVVSAPRGATLVNVVGERRSLRPGTSHRLHLTEDLVYVLGQVTVRSLPAEETTDAQTRSPAATDEVHREPVRGQSAGDGLRRQDRSGVEEVASQVENQGVGVAGGDG